MQCNTALHSTAAGACIVDVDLTSMHWVLICGFASLPLAVRDHGISCMSFHASVSWFVIRYAMIYFTVL